VTPITKCRLRQLKLERIKDYLLMEEEFVEHYQKKEQTKPEEDNVLLW
jgi:26S proteasome regulatory subunit T2